MIQFSDFYDDIDFMIALFFNGMLNNADIYEISNRLNNKISDDGLDKIIANGVNGNNKRLFGNYLNALGIKLLDPKRALIAKVFYYILHDRIDFNEGIEFARYDVSSFKEAIEYVGDDVGISRLLGNYFAIDDGDLKDEKDIKTAKGFIFRDMRQYVNDNLMKFPVGNIKNNLKDKNPKVSLEKKPDTKTEMEKSTTNVSTEYE
jgi:hypothetical protein